MKYIHRITGKFNQEAQRELGDLGITVPADDFASFEVDEAGKVWPYLVDILSKFDVGDYVSTEFSKKELDRADWLVLEPRWFHGYPQPRDNEFGYLEATYDLTNYCRKCDLGRVQDASFQMKREPKWGRRDIMQMHWVYDEFFVTPEIWTSVFKPFGIECKPVVNTKGIELKSVVQLVVQEYVGMKTDGLVPQLCPECNRAKYAVVKRGMYPALIKNPIGHMVKTQELFGSGGSAFNCIIISQALARAMSNNKVSGYAVSPIAPEIESI